MSQRWKPSASTRGFTLIELMTVSTMLLIVMTSVFGAMLAQQSSLSYQLDRSQSSQSARAALSIIKRELRMAGWGLDGLTAADDLDDTGIFPVGSCRDASDVFSFGCNGGTSNPDRIRIVSMEPTYFVDSAEQSGTNFGAYDGGAAASTPAIPDDAFALIEGECGGGGVFDRELVSVQAATVGTFTHGYTPNNVTGYANQDCSGAFNSVRLSWARVVDFWVENDELKMQVNRGQAAIGALPASAAQTVAYNIDSIQFQYGIDMGAGGVTAPDPSDTTPDQVVNKWCHDLTSNCAGTHVTTHKELAARVVAVRVGVVGFTRSKSGSQFTAFDHTINAPTDPKDYRSHWLFRSTVSLRNNDLR